MIIAAIKNTEENLLKINELTNQQLYYVSWNNFIIMILQRSGIVFDTWSEVSNTVNTKIFTDIEDFISYYGSLKSAIDDIISFTEEKDLLIKELIQEVKKLK